MNLIIVSGPEATGKTAIGKEVAGRLGIKYRSKDMIKEAMFDEAPRSTWDYSWYENRAKDEFFKVIKDFIERNESVMIESNFIGPDKERLARLLNDRLTLTEIYCTAKGMTTLRRFIRRNENGTRHKGHHDRRWYPKIVLEALLRYIHIEWPSRPVGLTKRRLVVDSTDFSKVDYDAITDFVR